MTSPPYWCAAAAPPCRLCGPRPPQSWPPRTPRTPRTAEHAPPAPPVPAAPHAPHAARPAELAAPC
eukprot:scaffold19009_cov55-Phaeocystis_antarctica.AAC.8